MAIALILTIIPVTLILVLLVLTTGSLTPLAAVSFTLLLGLVVIVFAGLLRSARRMQPPRADGHQIRSDDLSQPAEEDAETSSPDAEDAVARWSDDGGSARP